MTWKWTIFYDILHFLVLPPNNTNLIGMSMYNYRCCVSIQGPTKYYNNDKKREPADEWEIKENPSDIISHLCLSMRWIETTL